ncbi:MAG: carboxypeptidase regulatory-like domain-containing protein, partial [Thermoplasmata archaeon]|nr:carboxypeptidase regulatory-like domain-containing protein [Thermoplasmata archaeon]
SPWNLYSVSEVGKVLIGWSAPYYDGNGVDGYMVFRRDDLISYWPPDFIGDVDADTLTIVDDTGAVGQDRYYFVKAYNSAGESIRSEYLMTASLLPPSEPAAVIETPANGSFLNSSDIAVIWSGEGYGLPILEYEVMVDSGDWVNVAGDTSYQVVGLSDGPHTIQVRMVTALGWHLSNVTEVIVDTTRPTLTLLNTTALLLINASSATVHWEGVDASSGVAAYWIKVDNGAWVEVGLVDNHTVVDLVHGTHVVLVRAYDEVGLYDEKTFNITVDLIAPYAVEFGPTGAAHWNGTQIYLSFSEEVFDLRVEFEPEITIGYIWDPQPGDHFRFNYSGFDPGVTYNLTATCRDRAGNAMTPLTWNFTILPEASQGNITIYYIITGRVLDENGEPLVGVQVILVGVNITHTDENGYYNFTAEQGTYDIYINVEGFFDHRQNFTTGNGSGMDLDDIFLREIVEDVDDPVEDEPRKTELPLVPIVVGVIGGGIIGIGVYVMKKRGEKTEWDFEEEEGDEDYDFEEEEEQEDFDEE